MKRVSFFLLVVLGLAVILMSCRPKSTPLPVIAVNVDSLSWEHKQPCSVEVTTMNNTLTLPAKIKLRGGSSSRYFKHSFALELEEAHNLLGLPIDDDWVLNANYIDKTMMRHKISYDLFREMNAQQNKAALCTYVNLQLNGNYEGLYVLMQKINAGLLGLDKKDPHAVLFKDPPIFRDTIAVDTGNCYEQKFPKWKKEQRLDDILAFRNLLTTADDITFAKNIAQWIDIDNVVDWHLLLLFTNNGDGLVKNFYLYKTSSEEPFRIAIWDYDHSFGRDCDGELNMLERMVDINKNLLLRRLWKMPEYQSKVAKRWFELRKSGVFSEKHFKKMVQFNDQQIRNEVDNNFEKWPVDAADYYDAATYQEELDLMLKYVPLRIKQLDDFMKKIPY